MGQYWKPVNLDKREFIHPHKLDSGLKLWEIITNANVGRALCILCAAMPEARGGGDLDECSTIGRWAGDRIVLIGDYAEDSDLPPQYNASKIYEECNEGIYTDITEDVCKVLEHELGGNFITHEDGYAEWKCDEE